MPVNTIAGTMWVNEGGFLFFLSLDGIWQEAIYKLTVMVGGDFVPINDALSMLSNMRSKSVRQTTSCRTGLQVGTITIPVELYFIDWNVEETWRLNPCACGRSGVI